MEHLPHGVNALWASRAISLFPVLYCRERSIRRTGSHAKVFEVFLSLVICIKEIDCMMNDSLKIGILLERATGVKWDLKKADLKCAVFSSP